MKALQKFYKQRPRLVLALLLAAALALAIALPPRDQPAELTFHAQGEVLALEEEGGRVVAIVCRLAGAQEGETRRYPLAPRCRVTGPSGKVSAHSLPGREVYIHFVEKKDPEGANATLEIDLLFVKP